MAKDVEVELTLVNSEAVENIETVRKKDFGSKAESGFAHSVCGGFLGKVGTREVARNIGAEIKAQIEKPGELIQSSPVSLLMIPHHFSVRRAQGNVVRHIASVGVLVEFLPEEQYFAIIDLIPNSSYKKILEAGVSG